MAKSSFLLSLQALVRSSGAVAALLTMPALAHHSYSMFDFKKAVSISGTVAEFQWSNPHVFIEVDTSTGADTTRFSVEAQSIHVMTSMGWNHKTLKAGDRVNLKFFPLRNGNNGGSLAAVSLGDGRVLNAGSRPLPPEEVKQSD